MEEGNSISKVDDRLREMLAEFLVGVTRFEDLVEIGRKLLIRFQQALEFLRRPSIYESSELIKEIIEANKTERVNAYIEAGCMNTYDSTQSVCQLNTSLSELRDTVSKAKAIINELEDLMDEAGKALRMNSNDHVETEFEGFQQDATASEELDAAGCASYMAVIYSMVNQDFTMQEKIVSSLNYKSSSSELESYCLMWSLRPFIDDDVIHQALRQIR